LDSLLRDDEEPLPGTHILSPRRGYLHHGIYVGEGRVVHYAGLARGLFGGPVEEVFLTQFARGRSIWMRWGRQPAFDPAEVVRRARSRVGEEQYQILENNCEHFCEWCIHGQSRSYQVERLLSSRHSLAILLEIVAWWDACCARVRLSLRTMFAASRSSQRAPTVEDPDSAWDAPDAYNPRLALRR